MTNNKFDPYWAEDTDLTGDEPSDAKIQVGWVSGTNADRPRAEYFNYLQKRVEEKINDIIDDQITNIYDPDDTRDAIATGLWHGMTDVISGGATKAYVDLCCYVNSDNEPKIMGLHFKHPPLY